MSTRGRFAAPRRSSPAQGDIDDSEQQLVERCRCGDRAALEAVLGQHADMIERQILRLVGPGPEVADLLQVALLTAVRAFPRFRGEAQLSTWLTGIAINVVRDHLKRPQQKIRFSVAAVPDEAHQSTPEDAYFERTLLEGVRRALRDIPAKNRIAFILHVVEGRPVEEVAALCQASVTATKSRIFFARRALKRALRDEEGGTSRERHDADDV